MVLQPPRITAVFEHLTAHRTAGAVLLILDSRLRHVILLIVYIFSILCITKATQKHFCNYQTVEKFIKNCIT